MKKDMDIYYTNATGIEMTNLDIKIKAKYRTRDEIIDLCDLVFSPEQAKLTSMMLSQAVEEYEKKYRKINIDPSAINRDEAKEQNEK